MNKVLENMAKGLVRHYLQGGTIEDAVRLGEHAGLPQDLLVLPGMMFIATSAACAVSLDAKTLEETVEILVKEGAPEADAPMWVSLALNCINALGANGGLDRPLPLMRVPWFEFEDDA